MRRKFKKVDKRGFTLIELLATIVIVALVLSITGYGVSRLVGTSKNKSKVISMSSIKESASVYSDEDSDRWIEPYSDSYSYFCTTIEELINKGIISKDATLPDGVSKSNYVSVKKNRTTLVKSEAIVLDSASSDSSAYKVCTGNDIKSEDVSSPSISGNASYTDSLIVNFNDGDDDGIKDKWCQYDTVSSIEDGKNVIVLNKDDSSCRIDNLKDNTTYYVRVCKTTNGGSRACSNTPGYKTSKFVNPTISYSNLTSIIKFNDSGIESGKALHYFKSNISANSKAYVYECDNEFNCSNTTTKSIISGKWYMTGSSSVTIDYGNSDGVENGVIYARISDGSNYSNVTSEFTLYKVVFKVGSADSIDGGTSDITKRCLSERGKTCSITSPSISKYCYSGMGWSTTNNANSSSWAPLSSKNVSSSGVYYPSLGSIITYAINYNANGGYNAPSMQYKTCGKSLTLSSTTPSRTNYNFTGWSTSSNGYVSYYPGSTYSNNSSVTLYAQWSYRYYCSYTGLRYDSYSEALEACSVTTKYTANKISHTTKTYSCPSGYSCSGSCNSSSTCSKTTNGTVTTKYYCSHNGSYQSSSTCSYTSGYYESKYNLTCSNSSSYSYSCDTGVLDTGKCYADYYTCPSGWTRVKANGYCSIECGELTQGVSKSHSCTTTDFCSSYSSACCYYNGSKICGNTERAGCRITAYQYQCSKDATKVYSKVYSAGSLSSSSETGSCASGYTASKSSSCSNPPKTGYCDTRDYWKGQSCKSDIGSGATARWDKTCSKTGDTRYYCSITGEYTSSRPSCTSTDTEDISESESTTYSCPSGYSEDSSGGCYKYVTNNYTVS